MCDCNDPLHFQVEPFSWEHVAYVTPVPELCEERVCATTRVQRWDPSPSRFSLSLFFFLVTLDVCWTVWTKDWTALCVSMYIDSKCLAAIGWHEKGQCFGHLRGARVVGETSSKLCRTFVRNQWAGVAWLPQAMLKRRSWQRTGLLW